MRGLLCRLTTRTRSRIGLWRKGGGKKMRFCVPVANVWQIYSERARRWGLCIAFTFRVRVSVNVEGYIECQDDLCDLG